MGGTGHGATGLSTAREDHEIGLLLANDQRTGYPNILDSYSNRWANFLVHYQQVSWIILSAKENKVVPKLWNGQSIFHNLVWRLRRLSVSSSVRTQACSYPASGQRHSSRLTGLKNSWGPVESLRGNTHTHTHVYIYIFICNDFPGEEPTFLASQNTLFQGPLLITE